MYEAMVDELGDVMWYVGETAAALGVTLEEVARHNIEKLRKRYPDGFDSDRSLHREG
jgi:NTP pyrophosphatase (non-canonical NTP hydrolase)